MKVKELRLNMGLSQAELAEMAHVTRQGVSLIERGQRKPHPRTVRRLAEALGVEIAELRQSA